MFVNNAISHLISDWKNYFFYKNTEEQNPKNANFEI